MTDYEYLTLIARVLTIAVLIGIMIILALYLPVLAHAAQVYVTMYG